jgi:hypothetical protein
VNKLVPISSPALPALAAAAGERADKSQLRTELARSPSRHAATDSEGLGS